MGIVTLSDFLLADVLLDDELHEVILDGVELAGLEIEDFGGGIKSVKCSIVASMEDSDLSKLAKITKKQASSIIKLCQNAHDADVYRGDVYTV